MNKTRLPGPVAIGGVGGSGTRVVAEILKDLGFYIGGDLNGPSDNVWFTLLFKRPRWYIKNSNGKPWRIFKGLRIFEKAMTGRLKPRADELNFIVLAALDIWCCEHISESKPVWLAGRVKTIARSRKLGPQKGIGWGWKEPNTHIYLEYLHQHFADLKYIHVIRHGLDMAYSKNQQQLENWGQLFGMSIPSSPELLPEASLRFWIKANEAAITQGKHLLSERFLVVNFDELCSSPKKEIEKIIAFLELDSASVDTGRLCSLVKPSRSIGRYKDHDLSIFSQEEIDAVRDLGFAVDEE